MNAVARSPHSNVLHRAALTLASDKSEQQEALRRQVVDQYRNHFHITVSIFKGITLGAAAYALLAILAANGTLGPRVELTALGFWVASFAVMVVTYDAMMLHSLITIAAPNTVDMVIPFLFGIAEFSLFPILTPILTAGVPSQSTAAALSHLSWWLLGMTFIALVGSLFMLNAQSSLNRTLEALPPHLQAYIVRFKSLQRKNQIGTAAALLFTLSAFIVLRYGLPHLSGLGWLPSAAEMRQWEGVLSVLFIANAIMGIWSGQQMRRELADTLSHDAACRPDDPLY